MRRGENVPRSDPVWDNVKPISEALFDLRPPSVYSSPRLGGDIAPPMLVAPPPPILFFDSQSSSSRVQTDSKAVHADADVVMHSPPAPSTLTATLPSPSADSQFRAQSEQAAQPRTLHRPQEKTRPTGRYFDDDMDDVYPTLPRVGNCCSIEKCKAEIKSLMDTFKREYEDKLAKAFGPDWDKPDDVEYRLPHLPSPPTHLPTLPEISSRHNVWVPPPPPPLPRFGSSLPPPPPPPPPMPFIAHPHTYIPPPPPPPLPCVVPPPPCLFPLVNTPPPPPSWIPAVAFNPTQESPATREAGRPTTERRESEQIVHKDVRCDYCGKSNIEGTRYKCLQCPGVYLVASLWSMAPDTWRCIDFDWCNSCMASPKAWEAHTASHAFFPIHKTEDFLHFCLVKDQRARR